MYDKLFLYDSLKKNLIKFQMKININKNNKAINSIPRVKNKDLL